MSIMQIDAKAIQAVVKGITVRTVVAVTVGGAALGAVGAGMGAWMGGASRADTLDAMTKWAKNGAITGLAVTAVPLFLVQMANSRAGVVGGVVESVGKLTGRQGLGASLTEFMQGSTARNWTLGWLHTMDTLLVFGQAGKMAKEAAFALTGDKNMERLAEELSFMFVPIAVMIRACE